MSTRNKKTDRVFLAAVIALTAIGFLIFISSALGLYGAEEGTSFWGLVLNQAAFGLALGIAAAVLASRVHYKFWKRNALPLIVGAFILTAAVFIPGFGFEHGGARRWLSLGPFSFQPAEFLKLSFVIYFAAWASSAKDKVASIKYGLAPFLTILSASGAILLLQPDTSGFIILVITALAILFAAGGRWKHILFLFSSIAAVLAILTFTTPYIHRRISVFLNPSLDPLGAGYQIRQALIAVGSGGLFGRGFGKSVQKFNYLPEPVGDSVFAVAAEEFGFAGSIVLLSLFVIFSFRGLGIAVRASDDFSRLLVTGIVILIISQSFINMASMVGLFPLTGTPLLFVSQGGTALLTALAASGIVMNVSKYRASHSRADIVRR